MLRRIVGFVVVSGLWLAGVGVLVVPAASADDGTAAVVEKVGASLVQVRTQFLGQVKMAGLRGESMWSDTFIVTGQCTGYVVDPRGYIATAGHCVDGTDTEIHNALRLRMATDAATTLGMDSAWARKLYALAVSDNWQVRGDALAADPRVEVSVRQPAGADQVLASWTDADVVDHQPFTAGDNAVIKINSAREIAALVISDQTPTPGDAVISVGFPGAVQSNAGGAQVPQPSYKTGTVSSRQVDDSGITRTEISATMGSGMSGGPTVDSTGEVIGTNSSGNSLPDEKNTFNFITDNLALRTYLSSHGVTLARPDTEERRSMWTWVAPVAGAFAAVVVIVLIAMWLRRRRRRSRPPGPVVPGGVAPQNPCHSPQSAGWSAAPAPVPVASGGYSPAHMPGVRAPAGRQDAAGVPGPGYRSHPVTRGAIPVQAAPVPWSGPPVPRQSVPQQTALPQPVQQRPVPPQAVPQQAVLQQSVPQQSVPLWRGQASGGPQQSVGARPQATPGPPSVLQMQPTVQVKVPAAPQAGQPQNG